MMIMTVSIIVPIYNVERHIEVCVRSLMSQTYDNIEFIFVDDASPDSSIEILNEVLLDYPSRAESTKFVKHDVNKGLPAARNTGISHSNGHYIFHCDADDWIESTMVEDLIIALAKYDADIAYCDFFLTFHHKERYMSQPNYCNAKECIQSMLRGKMKYNVWNKIVKRSLYEENDIMFPKGKGMGEDMTVIKLFAHAKRVVHVPRAYYHYMQTNPNAYTKSFNDSHLSEVLENAHNIISYIEKKFGEKEYFEEIHFFKLNVKLPLLFSGKTEMFSIWRSLFTSSHPFIMKNPEFSKRTKLIQWAAIKKQDWLICVYNFMMFRVIYGVIYR